MVPAVSAFSLAAARLGWPLAEVETVSLHGRAVERVRPLLHPGTRILALTSDGGGAGGDRAAAGGGRVRRVAADGAGGAGRAGGAAAAAAGGGGSASAACAALNLVAIEVEAGPEARVLSLGGGLADGLFAHDGQISKREVRAVTLSALAPRRGELLWDIGAGAGSVAIEWMLLHPSLRAVAVEARADRAARIAENARAFGVPELARRRPGEAPAALAGLPAPDAIFVGGGGSDPGVLEAAEAALRPGGRLVANAVTLEMQARLLAGAGRLGRDADDDRDRAGGAGGRDDRLAAGDAGDAMGLGEAVRVAGIGCRRGVTVAEVLAALDAACGARGVSVDALAVLPGKRGEAALGEAAARRGLPLRIAEGAVAPERLATRSAASLAATGTGSASEAAALAVAGPAARLLGPRLVVGRVTCAIAVGRDDGAFHRRRAGGGGSDHRARARSAGALPGLPLCRLDRAARRCWPLPAGGAAGRYRAAVARRDRGGAGGGARARGWTWRGCTRAISRSGARSPSRCGGSTALGIPYTLTPGVPAFAAAAAALGRELTIPEVAQSLVLTRVSGRASAMPAGETLAGFGATGATLAIHLAIHALERVVAELLPLYGADCPVAVVARASWPEERIVRGTLAHASPRRSPPIRSTGPRSSSSGRGSRPRASARARSTTPATSGGSAGGRGRDRGR